MKPTSKTNDWEERLLSYCDVFDTSYGSYLREDNVKSFVSSLLKSQREELTKDRKSAKQCLNYLGFRCKRKECLNESCPLNKVNEEEDNE